MDAIDICVPTPLRKTKDPDLSYVVRPSRRSRRRCKPGQLVILESTTYPGTTDEVVQPMLEASGPEGRRRFLPRVLARARRSGQPAVQHAEHPEDRRRRRPGEHRGGGGALRRDRVSTVVPVSSTRVAEMVKLLENTFRAVNIGLVNEIALMCHKMDIDVWEVIDAAKTKPFGFMPFYPGPRPRRPLHSDRSVLSVVEGAAERLRVPLHRAGRPGQRRRCPQYVVERVADALNTVRKPINGSRVHLFGVAYKRDVDDMRESPALDVLELLDQARRRRSATRDPYVPTLQHGGAHARVGRSKTAALAAQARLRRHLHRSLGVRLRRARPRRRADRRHAQRAEGTAGRDDLPPVE